MTTHSKALIVITLAAAFTYAQAPATAPVDPHENPAIQNAPEGKKVSAKDAAKKTSAVKPATKSAPKAAATKTAAKAKTAANKRPVQPVTALDAEAAMLGTWNLVREQSTFQPGPPPKSETRTYAKTPTGIMATIVTTMDDGTIQTTKFPWTMDGSEHPAEGTGVLDAVQLKQVDNLTAEATLKHGGKELARERRMLSADGKTMSIEVTDMVSDDHPVTIKALYQKQ